MTNTILTHDAAVRAFDDAGGVVESGDDEVSFNWDEKHIVTVDAPSDLEGAFDTDQFYKISDATIARPIKQRYFIDGELKTYKKPADALRRAAWTFDNKPFTITHPDSGMVKNVDDIHGFWRGPHYDDADHRLKENLYIPINDDEAVQWIEDNKDVSVGFYNRTVDSFDGDTGGLTDDEGVDGYQVQMYGNHIAGVERGRCDGEDGCGLDSDEAHGTVVAEDVTRVFDQSTTFTQMKGESANFPEWEEGDMVQWQVNPDMYGEIVATDESRKIVMVELMDGSEESGYTLTAGYTDIRPMEGEQDSHTSETDNSPDTTEDCGCTTNMTNDDNTDGFDVPDLNVDTIAEQNDAVAELRAERDELRSTVDEMEEEVREALDTPDNFSIELDEDECVCEGVEELAKTADEAADKAGEVEDLRDELEEYRADEKEEALDELEELGADRDEYEDESLDEIETEIDRREEVLDAAPDVSVKDTDTTTDSGTDNTAQSGPRKFDRGYGA